MFAFHFLFPFERNFFFQIFSCSTNSISIQNKFTDDEETRPSGVHATKMGPEDIQLHVHSDHGTGGHWCAKVFFFSLLAILLGLIGLILLENRGLSDREYDKTKFLFI